MEVLVSALITDRRRAGLQHFVDLGLSGGAIAPVWRAREALSLHDFFRYEALTRLTPAFHSAKFFLEHVLVLGRLTARRTLIRPSTR
jgi:hypothetical protein